MGVNQKDKPTGVDKIIDIWQLALYNGLTNNKGWLNYESYARVYKDIDNDGNVNPLDFITNNDYNPVSTDDRFTVTSFFLVSDDSDEINGLTESVISVIFQIDLNKLYTSTPHRFDEELINDVKAINRNLDGRFRDEKVLRGIEKVYSEFDTDKIKEGLRDRHPYNVVRFDMTVRYQYNCGDVYASTGLTCDIGVTVSVTTVSSLGGSDGTATANDTDGQGNISYLWTTSDGSIPAGEEIKKTATGLTEGTYEVTVTDDAILSPACTAINSGVVVVECNLAVTVSVVDESQEGLNDGSATANITGDQGIITYLWNDPLAQTTQTATNLAPNTYEVLVTDSVTAGCTASDSGTVAAGAAANVLLFDNVNDFIEFASTVSYSTNQDYTVSFEVNPTTALGQDYILMGTGAKNYISLDFTNDRAVIRAAGSTLEFDLTGFTAGVWTTIIVVRSGGNGTMRVYQDGVESSTGSIVNNFAGNFTQVSHSASSGNNSPLGAKLDNVFLLTGTAADSTERAAIVADPDQAQTIMGAATLEYLLDGTGTDSTAIDTSGNGNTGTLTNFTSTPWVPR